MPFFRKRKVSSSGVDGGITILFATDIHGSEVCFRKFLGSAAHYGAQVIILGGDVTGNLVVPVVPQPGGGYVAQLGKQSKVIGEREREAFEQGLRDQGCYVFETDDSSVLTAGLDEREVELTFRKAMVTEFERWLEMAEDRLGGTGVRCFISPGNDDPYELDDVLAQSTYVENPDGRVVDLDGGVQMLSLGTTNPTPWASPRETSEDELEKQLEELVGGLADPSRAVFNTHCPPIGTELDQAPELDEDFNVRTVLGNPVMTDVGSTAVRSTIERYQPLIGLHGHVHESRAVTTLGRTLCINPGSAYGAGLLQGALVALDAHAVRSHQLVRG